jgi:hypothetical protein
VNERVPNAENLFASLLCLERGILNSEGESENECSEEIREKGRRMVGRNEVRFKRGILRR